MKFYPYQNILKSFIFFCLLASPFVWSEVKVTNVTVQSRWPWNGLVDIRYSVECDEKENDGKLKDVYVTFMGMDKVRNQKIPMITLTGDGAMDSVRPGGPYMVTWDTGKDYPCYSSAAFYINIQAVAGLLTYLVVDLSGGPSATKYPVRFSKTGPDLSNDICRTTELWLRRIQIGSFIMGTPITEGGHQDKEKQHQVIMSQIYFIGVFECTQRQWELVMGNNPSGYKSVDGTRPIESISYEDVRGRASDGGAGWPKFGHKVDSDSFMGRLCSKTNLVFDLPTEAQWEYACRAGTTTALNTGKSLITTIGQDANLDEVARNKYNRYDGRGGYTEHTKVGSYVPNAWGLYDMHGNVWEWCLDWYGEYPLELVENPNGVENGLNRMHRGGGWKNNEPKDCRSGDRSAWSDGIPVSGRYDDNGFRIVFLPFE